MEISLWQAIQEIRSGRWADVYAVYADSGDGGRWIADTILERAGNATRLDCRDENLRDAMGKPWEADLFGVRHLVVCPNADFLASSGQRRSGNDEWTQWINALLDEPPLMPVVLVAAAERLDQRRSAVKRLLESPRARVVHSSKMRRDEWRALAQDALGAGIRLEAPQWDEVLRRTGESLGILRAEMDKLRTYAGQRSSVDPGELDALLTHNEAVDVFEISRLLFSGRVAEACSWVIRRPPDSAFSFFALLARQYRIIAAVKAAPGRSDADLSAELGVHPYACKVAREQGKKVPEKVCARQVRILEGLEHAVKSGRLSEQAALDLFFLRLLTEEAEGIAL